jgi:histone-lysine N-methyltransferase SETMAR
LKLRDAIHRKRPGQLARGVLLHHDNARPHTTRATQERIQELQWELLEHLFGLLKNYLGGKHFADNEEAEMKVLTWLRQQSEGFHGAGSDALVK